MQRPETINDDQWQAITHREGHLLIVAGPGTGKTFTITHRIAHLLEHLLATEQILAITFTNKAATELRERVHLVGNEAEERRLFYVGMTRAKHSLYLVNAQQRSLFGKTYQSKPLRFLADIEQRLKEIDEQKIVSKNKKQQQLQLKW